ncbi:hypothetical protein QBC47DRAFT_387409 [Echria macrotheca]|uniref:Uncharacterized protein n=1 Tax=Echria macrotheca TaxID=438768 RepID=A0AAJ0B7G6_9PEZI|nr:hypothetical protein QBC47DRAFT_387409 [Echria macrotheca]
MHSIAIASLLAVAATFTSAAPTGAKQPRAYYVCAINNFRGECSVDPCAISWCPDYKWGTYEPVSPAPVPVPAPAPAPATTPKAFYVCANNNFRGDCSVDPCAISWCPDYKPGTYEPVAAVKRSDPTVCAPGTGYFQSCSNGFRGCCKGDACGNSWCPDSFNVKRSEVVTPKRSDPTVCAPGTGFFQSCSNGFRGCCKGDACGNSWCPDTVDVKRSEAATPKRSDPTVCAPGTGFFQSCSNGFRGCCKGDACGSSWCPDFKFGTFEPIGTSTKTETKTTAVPVPETKPVAVQPGTCAPGTGYYQVCASGFKGCCKTDACTFGWCSA